MAQSIIWSWKRVPTSAEENDEFARLSTLLAEVSLSSEVDGWRWNGAAMGDYSVKAVKCILNNLQVVQMGSVKMQHFCLAC
ncbi:hypothetical protein HanIR_Chr08g0345611 [Helianthus annuus]|nr:hypothetical protein HanIR_Chr08g0345611 [Helianthus annuus]